MNTKLTLSIDKSVIENAKEYAKKEGRSLSEIVENYFKSITVNRKPETPKYSPTVSSLMGSVREPEMYDDDYKKDLSDALSKKYLIK